MFYGTDNAPIYWCLSDADLAERATPLTLRNGLIVNFGVMIIPIKLRPGFGRDAQVSFGPDFTLSTSLDLVYRASLTRNFFLHFPIFVGLGSVNITPNESTILTEDRSVSAFSFGFGIGVSSDDFGAGLLFGIDVIGNNGSIDWEYQNLPWIGLSIGKSFGSSSGQGSAGAPVQPH